MSWLRVRPFAHYSYSMSSKALRSLPIPKAAIAFLPEHLDFRRGIHVGNLEDHARITRILKLELEALYGEPFVTERYGRGVYWQWIGYLPRANRDAKPLSSKVSFGCSKLFLMVDTEDKLFKCGLQVERGYVKAPHSFRRGELRPDWDWRRLEKALRPSGGMELELKRLVEREGFRMHVGTWENPASFTRWPGAPKLRKLILGIPPNHWASFQVYYPMQEEEVKKSSGLDLIESMLAIFQEVTLAMNLTMQTHLASVL